MRRRSSKPTLFSMTRVGEILDRPRYRHVSQCLPSSDSSGASMMINLLLSKISTDSMMTGLSSMAVLAVDWMDCLAPMVVYCCCVVAILVVFVLLSE